MAMEVVALWSKTQFARQIISGIKGRLFPKHFISGKLIPDSG
jgi:hypothetical protein